jgi:hypothetical protein
MGATRSGLSRSSSQLNDDSIGHARGMIKTVATMFERLKRIVTGRSKGRAHRDRKARRRDPDSGSLLGKEVEQASPERAGEVAGHAVERVET